MQMLDKQVLENDYMLKFCLVVQSLIEKRKKLRISQSYIASVTGKSLKTIQNFENYKSTNYYLIYSYRQILNQPTI